MSIYIDTGLPSNRRSALVSEVIGEPVVDLSNMSYVPAIDNGEYLGNFYGTVSISQGIVNGQHFYRSDNIKLGDSFYYSNFASHPAFANIVIYLSDDTRSSFAIRTNILSGLLAGTSFGVGANPPSPGGVVPYMTSPLPYVHLFTNSDAVSENGITTNVTWVGYCFDRYTHLYKISLSNSTWYNIGDRDDYADLIADKYGVGVDSVEYLGTGYLVVTTPNTDNIEFSYQPPPDRIVLSPQLPYMSNNSTIDFKLEAIYGESVVDVTEEASWGLSLNTVDTPVSNFDGYSVEKGKVTLTESSLSYVVVSAKYGGYGQYTNIYTSDYKGVYVGGGTTGGIDGSSSTGGGGYFGKNPSTGQFETSDPITIPTGSAAGDASATGMMTRYLANSSQLEIFGDWLWSDDFGLAVAKAAISLLYGSPAEAVISLMSYPFDITSLSGITTREQNLYWGNHNSQIGATALTSPAATVDWGTISLNEYWGNFLDYEPHTKIELYLPWGTGFVSIDPGQCLPGTLRVVTNIDLNKGSCIHNVFGNNGCVIGTYAGQCSQQIPVISNDYASKIAGVVTAAVSLASTAGPVLGAGKGVEDARLDYQSNVPLPSMRDMYGMQDYYMGMEKYANAVSKNNMRGRTASNLASIGSVAAAKHTGIVSRNGSFTDGSAALGCQYPYIILSRPSQSVPKEYGSHYGYPSNIYTQLSNLKGYTEVGEIHLNGINATEPEITELDKILKGGVIF